MMSDVQLSTIVVAVDRCALSAPATATKRILLLLLFFAVDAIPATPVAIIELATSNDALESLEQSVRTICGNTRCCCCWYSFASMFNVHNDWMMLSIWLDSLYTGAVSAPLVLCEYCNCLSNVCATECNANWWMWFGLIASMVAFIVVSLCGCDTIAAGSLESSGQSVLCTPAGRPIDSLLGRLIMPFMSMRMLQTLSFSASRSKYVFSSWRYSRESDSLLTVLALLIAFGCLPISFVCRRQSAKWFTCHWMSLS